MTKAKQVDELKSKPKWYASGRGIFRRNAGFQLGTTVATANWQEDTARFVDLLNKGEEYELAVRNKVLKPRRDPR